MLLSRNGAAYEHEIVVDGPAIIAADKLAMHAIQVAANPTVTCRLEHMTDSDRSNDRSAGGLQSALAHGVCSVEIHDVR